MSLGMATAGATQAISGQISKPEWHDGLCDCASDTDICLQTFCCSICTLTNIINMRDLRTPTFDCCTCICLLAGTYLTNNRYPTWLSMSMRRELIQRYGIQGESQCNSCLLGMCCAPCTFCQVQREMGKRGEHVGGCCAKPPPAQDSMENKVMSAMTNVAVGVIGAVSGGEAGLKAQQPKLDFSTGICGCTCAECCEGIFCYPCVYGYIGNRIDADHMSMGGIEGAMDPAACCGAMWYPQGWGYMTRREVAERYNIVGETHLKSLIMVMCCPFCTALQARREMGIAGQWPGGCCVKEMPPQ